MKRSLRKKSLLSGVLLLFSMAAYSQTSDIIANTTFAYPTNIPYLGYNENSDITNSATSLVVAKFDVRDGGAAAPDAGADNTTLTTLSLDLGSNFSFINRIALYDADGTTELTSTEQAVSAQTVNFTGLTIVAPDNGTISFTVRVSFKSTVTDNQQISFTVSAATATGSTFLAPDAGGASSSTGGDNNRIEVIATKLRFVQQPSNTVVTAAMVPAPTVEAADANNNRDLDVTSTIGVVSTGTLNSTPQDATFVSGLGVYPAIVHTALGTGLTLNTNSGTLTNNPSNTFNIITSSASDIILNAGFTHPTDIAYATFSETTDITNSGTSLVVTKFDIRDGGASSDADNLSTVLTALTLDLGANFGFINRIALYDAAGTTEIALTEQAVSSQTVNFTGLTLTAPDNGSLTFSVRVSFKTTVTDNQKISFTVSSATAQSGNSAFAAANAGGAVSSTTGTNNQIEVTATKLLFVQQPSNTVSGVTMAPSPTVEAVDANNNRDLDVTSTIGVTSSGTMTGPTQNATFSAGLGTYSSIVHTVTGTGIQVTTNSGSLTNITSSAFNITASNSSDIFLNAGFSHPTNIAYAGFNANSDITNSATSVVVTKFDIRDGGGSSDADNLSTVLTALTLDLGTNFGFINRIALYDAAGTTEIATTDQAVSSQTVNFTGLTLTAPDNGSLTFSVRVSFKTTVTDNQQISFTVSAATAQSGNSAFAAANAGGAVSSTTGDSNRIEVTATKLRWVQNPPSSVFVGAVMSPSPTVEATDANNNRDLDYTTNVTVVSSGTSTGSTLTVAASSGLATFSNIVHTVAETGRALTATSGSLADSGASTLFNVVLSNSSDIIANGSFVYPTDIDYATRQATNIGISSTSIEVAQFILRDGGGTSDGDTRGTELTNITLDFGANFGLIRRVALYNGTTELGEVTVDATTEVMSLGTTITANDNSNATISVRVSFRGTVTDNTKFTITIASATAESTGSQFASANAGGATTDPSGTNNQIEVTATKLRWVQDPSSVDINDVMSPSPTVEAADALNNRDLDYTANVTVASTGTSTGSTLTAAAISGLATFSNIIHTVAANNLTMSATSGSLTASGNSATFDVISVSVISDIIANGSFTYPANIAYASNQATNLTGTSLAVAEFIIRDGATIDDPDSKGTILNTLTISVTNSSILRKLALYDGTTELNEQAVSGSSVTFSGFTVTAPDGTGGAAGTKTIIIRASFQSTVTDNTQFSFTITNTGTASGSSQFAAANAGGASTSTTGDNNRIEVTATKLLFIQQPTDTNIGVAMSPSPTVEATDANNNRDLDYVTNVTMASSGTLSGTSTTVVAPLSGLATFSNLIHSATGSNLTLTASSGSLTNGVSGLFAITTSANSDIIANTSFTYPANIAYGSFQESVNIQNDANSLNVAKFDLRDGGATSPDADALGTTLTDLTLDLGSNFGFVRRIALYEADGITEIAGTEQAVSAQTVNFSALTINAADGGTSSFTVRVSLTTSVTDNQQLSFTITSATAQATGSVFASANAGGASSSVAGDNNRIEVVATKLLFVQQPANTVMNIPMAVSPSVQAVDVNNIRDLDNSATVNASSTGTLSTSPTTTLASGLGTFSAVTHSAAGTGFTLSTTNAGGLTNITSGTFNIIAPSSDIIANTTFTYPANVIYTAFQEPTNIQNSGTSLVVAQFDVRDGGSAPDGDSYSTTLTNLSLDLGSNFGFIRRIALYDALGTTEISEQAVSSQTVSFSSLSITAPDDGSISFTVRVSFNTSVTDNQQYTFTVSSATALSGDNSRFAAANAGGAVTSTLGDNNRIEVTATKFLFVVQPPNTVVNIAMSPSPSVEATDANNNRDLDNTSTLGLSSTGTMTPGPTATLVAGIGTFSSVIHTVTGTAFTLTTTNSDLLTNATSSSFTIIANSSDVIANAAFPYPTNIAYASFQENTDIQNTGTSLNVARFDIRDGGGAVDGDNFSTVLTDLTLDLGANFNYIQRIALYDAAGTSEIASTEQAVSSNLVSFSGLTLTAPDDGSQSFTVRVSFSTFVVDNNQFSFTVNSVTSTGNSSRFAAANGGGAVSSLALDNNRIEVTATKLLFVQQPTNTSNGATMNPSPTVEAVDANNRRDLDVVSTIGVTSTGTMTGSPQNATFASGLGTYSSIVHTVNGTGLTLSTNSGSLTNATSSTFDITASNSSDIIANAAFIYPANIAYNLYQESSNIQNSTTSLVVAKFDVRDGGAAANDVDLAPTVLTNLTLNLGSNSGFIRRIALYDAAGISEIAEQAVTGATVSFSGLSITALDNSSISFTVRVSFTTSVTDNERVSFTISSATALTGSSGFASANAGGATTSTVLDNNKIEVTATKLLFVQGPTNTLTGNAMTPDVTVEATDALNNRDLDVVSTIGITSTGTLSISPQNATFVAGLGTYSGIVHTALGTGFTLSTNSGPLTNATSTAFNITSSNASDIVENALFTYPQNIAYNLSQENSDIQNTPTSIVTAQFTIRDGGGTVDADGAPTVLTALSLDLGSNFSYIRRIALYDATGTTEIPGTDQLVSAQTVNFSGLNLSAPDNLNLTFSVRVSFTTAVVDNEQFSFTITSATEGTSSQFAAADAGGASSSISGDRNKIEVTAVRLNFIQQPTNTLVNVAMSPSPTVEAIDGNSLRDLDNTATVGLTSDGTLSTTPSATLVAGFGTYSTITHSAAGTLLKLTTTNLSGLTNATSNTFEIIAKSSDIVLNPVFIHPKNIPYHTFQEASNIINSGTSVVVAKFNIRDGGAGPDGDAFSTTLTDLTLDLGTNFSYIRRIALYDASGITEIAGTEQAVSSQTVSFSGLSLTAPDNGSLTFSVRVSFTTSVVDNNYVSFAISSATAQSATSEFAAADAGGAISSTTGDDNKIEVTATKLLFVVQPSNTLNGISMTPAVEVEATDGFNRRDLDVTSVIGLTSTGTLNSSPVNATFIAGLGTYSSIQHVANGAGLILSTNSPTLTNAPSNTFDITPSTASDIIANAAFAYPQNIEYINYQENIDVQNSASSIVVAKYDIRDGGSSFNDADGAPTVLTALTLDLGANYSFIRRIALYDALGLNEIAGTDQAVASQTVNFSGISVAASDDGSQSFTVRVSFNTVVVDNQQFSFSITSATPASSSLFAAANAGGAATTTASDNNRIEAIATKFVFTTAPTATIYANVPFSPAPLVLEARDIYDIKDLDYNQGVNITNSGNIPMSDAAGHTSLTTISVPFSAGVLTLDNQLRYDIRGNGDGTLTIKDPTPGISLTSNAIAVLVSSTSDIVEASFSYPDNILYKNYQSANIDLTSSGDEIEVAQFTIRDGGVSSPDADLTATELTSITFTLTNSSFIRQLALYNGSTELSEVTVSGPNVTFPSFIASAADGATLTLSLYATFNTVVADNQQITFTVNNATVNPDKSVLPTGSSGNAGGATTTLPNTDDNRIEVVATKLNFSQLDATDSFITPYSTSLFPANGSINIAFNPRLGVEASDLNDNRDLDFQGVAQAVTAFSIANGLTSANPPSIGSQFTAGTLKFPVNFQYTSGNEEDGTLTMTAGGITSSSPPIQIVSSFESQLLYNSYGAALLNVNYKQYTNSTNISVTSTSIRNATPVLGLRLIDGVLGTNGGDNDGANTVLSDLVVGLTNPQSIARIALYATNDNGASFTEHADVPGSSITVSSGYGQVSFSGVNISALDNNAGGGNYTDIYVMVTFKKTSPEITDNTIVEAAVLSATVGEGSKFRGGPGDATFPTGYIGGVLKSQPTLAPSGTFAGAIGEYNYIRVYATKLDFTTQPPSFAGINEPVPLVQNPSNTIRVEARDEYEILDVDVNPANGWFPQITSPQASLNLTNVGGFNNGVLDLANLQYTGIGNGRLTVTTTNGITLSSNSTGSVNTDSDGIILGNASTPTCIPVDVINVFTTIAKDGVIGSGGSGSLISLASGAIDQLIYGVTFNAPYTVLGEPKLNSFTISFDGIDVANYPLNNILENARIYENTTASYQGSAIAPGATVTIGTEAIVINFGSTPRDLNATSSKQISYFLMVDVKPTASSAIPQMTPKVLALGYSDPATDGNIVISNGSAYSSNGTGVGPTVYNTYVFAAVDPPTLAGSNPFSGQLNADQNGSVILTFDVPVMTYDQKIYLYKKDDATAPVITMTLDSSPAGTPAAVYPGPANVTPASGSLTMKFDLPTGITLEPNTVYYVLIAQGSLGDADTPPTGIGDASNNLFPGISSPLTLYFKTSNLNPPVLSVASVPLAIINLNGFGLQTRFDQKGRAYYLVLEEGVTPPQSNAQILSYPNPAAVIAEGNFEISQANTTLSTYVATATTLTDGNNYKVYIFAENDKLPSPPVQSAGPYGASPSFTPQASPGPVTEATVVFTAAPASGTGVILPAFNTNVCPNSFQILTSPITIVERTDSDFTLADPQKLNLILPTGYQFDISTDGSGNPVYGTVSLTGDDFSGSGSLRFLSNSVLQVRFTNTTSGSFDAITITGLKFIATSHAASGSGKIMRLGGNALPGIADLDEDKPFAKLSLSTPIPANFTNDYLGNSTVIPDNAPPVRLIPVLSAGDYGPSSFSGTGVNVDQFFASAATLSTNFPITMTHTDNFGCVTTTSITYLVYDHNNAIRNLDTDYCTTNAYTDNPSTAAITVTIDKQSLGSAFYLEEFTANLPSVLDAPQLLDEDWVSVLQDSTAGNEFIRADSSSAQTVNSYNPVRTFYNYIIDLSKINNAMGPGQDPYSYFADTVQVNGVEYIYGSGGSLGDVEFKGIYRSVTNQNQTIPIFQRVEMIIPAVPIILIPTLASDSITTDPSNPVPVFCQKGQLITINGFPAASGSSTGKFAIFDVQSGNQITAGLIDNGNGTAVINPDVAFNGYRDIRITYRYKAAFARCESYVSKIIRIVPNPIADFTTDLLCEDRDIQFTDASAFAAGATSDNIVSQWLWEFADANSGPLNNSTIQNPVHKYVESGLYNNVQLRIRSNYGCPSVTPASKNLNIGGTPVVNFSIVGVSENDQFVFDPSAISLPASERTSASNNDKVARLAWSFGDGATSTVAIPPSADFNGPFPAANHSYSVTGPSVVGLVVTSVIGCQNALQQNIVVLPYKAPVDANIYSEAFANAGGYYTLTHNQTPSSWQFANGAWSTTGNAGVYRENEKSSLFTPAFNITGLSRPIMTFMDLVNTLTNDGVAVQYSTDSLNITNPQKQWITIGTEKSGIDWYNAQSVAANPGDQPLNQFAFSQKFTTQVTPVTVESKHSLSEITPAKRGRVVFRFAFASLPGRQAQITNGDPISGAPPYTGFTLDDVRIGTGTRTVLIENFTNTSTNGVKSENDVFRGFPNDPNLSATLGVELVKVDYHIALQSGTTSDPFNEENPADPGARALFYNISTVPQTRMDGKTGPEEEGTLFSQWGIPEFNRRILDLANANIDATISVADGQLTVTGSFTTIDALPGTTLLQIAVIEENVTLDDNPGLSGRIGSGETEFYYILKKLLPGAAGTKYVNLAQGVTETFEYTWNNPRLLGPEDDIAVIIFLQQENSDRKVYQSYLVRSADPEAITGVDPERVIGLFPNPADHEFTFELAKPVNERTPVRLYDQMGKVINESYLEKGESRKTIGTSTYAAGVYVLQLDSKDNFMRKKVMIIHKN